jgi:hypothetical protein
VPQLEVLHLEDDDLCDQISIYMVSPLLVLHLEDEGLGAQLSMDGAPAHLQPPLQALLLADEEALEVRPHLHHEVAGHCTGSSLLVHTNTTLMYAIPKNGWIFAPLLHYKVKGAVWVKKKTDTYVNREHKGN